MILLVDSEHPDQTVWMHMPEDTFPHGDAHFIVVTHKKGHKPIWKIYPIYT